jgi:CBS domain-containing protein
MLRVKDIMTKDIITIPQDLSVQEICHILIKHRLSGLPVIDKKKNLVGFVSERDIIASVGLKHFLNKKASDVMTKRVFSVKENVSAEEVSKIFTEKPFRYVPVMRGSKVVGVISRKDVIDRLLGQYY